MLRVASRGQQNPVEKARKNQLELGARFRSVSADFERSVVLKGIELYRFTLNPLTMAAPAGNPDNHCYCTDHEVTRNCTTAGVLGISSCTQGESAICQNRAIRVRLQTKKITEGLRPGLLLKVLDQDYY